MNESILARVASGDANAVRECIDEFGGLVWAIARRMARTRADAEDAVQEIFIDVWKSAGRFDPAQGSEKVFVSTIARRRLIDRLRRTKMNHLHDSEEALEDVRWAAPGNEGEVSLEAEESRCGRGEVAARPAQGTADGPARRHDSFGNRPRDRHAARDREDTDAAWTDSGTAVDEDRPTDDNQRGDALEASPGCGWWRRRHRRARSAANRGSSPSRFLRGRLGPGECRTAGTSVAHWLVRGRRLLRARGRRVVASPRHPRTFREWNLRRPVQRGLVAPAPARRRWRSGAPLAMVDSRGQRPRRGGRRRLGQRATGGLPQVLRPRTERTSASPVPVVDRRRGA